MSAARQVNKQGGRGCSGPFLSRLAVVLRGWVWVHVVWVDLKRDCSQGIEGGRLVWGSGIRWGESTQHLGWMVGDTYINDGHVVGGTNGGACKVGASRGSCKVQS